MKSDKMTWPVEVDNNTPYCPKCKCLVLHVMKGPEGEYYSCALCNTEFEKKDE